MNVYRTWPEQDEAVEYLPSTNPWLIQSSAVIVTARETGAELYRGPANDEG